MTDDSIIWGDYVVDSSGLGIIGPEPENIDYEAYCILQELTSMRKAGTSGKATNISIHDLYAYAQGPGQESSRVFYDLGFPDFYFGPVYLQASGALSTPSLLLELRFPESISKIGPYGDLYLVNHGFKLVSRKTGEEYSCLPELYQLISELNVFNSRNSGYRSTEEVLLDIARIKKFAGLAEVELDQILESEQIVEAGKIKLTIEGDDDCISIKPDIAIEGVSDGSFTNKFDKRFSVDGVYNFDAPKGRIRVVVPETKKRALRKIKQDLGNIRDPEKLRELLRNPPEEFDDADIDVSELYSDRVKGLGIYRPKTYPFICPYETEWIPGIIVDGLDGKKTLLIKDQATLEELDMAILTAESLRRDYVEYQGERIDLEVAKTVSSDAAALRTKGPVVGPPEGVKAKVLLIEENIEYLDYIEGKNERELEEIQCSVPGLDPSIMLKPYQNEGIARLSALYRSNYPGAILADDMGLGKTIQALGFLECMGEQKDGMIACIVSPVGLIGNWIEEYRKCFPDGNLILKSAMGDPSIVKKIREHREDFKNAIILFSYESLRRNQREFCATHWDIAILDEAQKIKTPGTLVTNAAKALWADFKVAMTGTPVENTFYDLWCISDFCMPGFLGSARSFATEFNPAKEDSEDAIKEKGERLRKKLGLRFLRRIKSDVLKDLPPKYESDNSEHSDQFKKTPTARIMPQQQRSAYDGVIREYREQKKTAENSGNSGKRGMLDVLYKLKTACEHPVFVESGGNSVPMDRMGESAKVLSLLDILDRVRTASEKVIVFAEYRRTQRFLAAVIHDRFGIHPAIINGDTPPGFDADAHSGTRLGIVREFNNRSGFGVVIMSPVAAGVGLTVTGANHVIHFSRHWNPSKEDQATDRAYRIGQTRSVYVYYLIARHPDEKISSFDDNLARLLFAKRSVRGAVLYPSERFEIKPEEVLKGTIGET
jgi:SNF2 family DNA or RNA helicase